MIIDEEDYLAHFGTPRHSGRYPWGSGGNEPGTTNNADLLTTIEQLKGQGLSDKQIYESLGMTSTQYRAEKSNAKARRKQAEVAQATRMKDEGHSNTEIGRMMGRNESYVRTLLAPGAAEKAAILTNTVDMLKEQVDGKNFIDVGKGSEYYANVSETKLRNALAALKSEGYPTHEVPIPQVGTGKDTRRKVLGPPGSTQKDAWNANRNADVQLIRGRSDDGGRVYTKPKIHDPLSIDPKRLSVKYAEDGGDEADGVIFVRRGVKDIELGGNSYAQVRVKVGDNHYLKGMAMYHDKIPDGVDLVFNSNKSNTGNKLDALKKISDDPENPFGAVVRQITADKGKDTEHVTSAMNIVNEEGDWAKWAKSLSSQMLSKQSPKLAKTQLDMTYEHRKNDYEDIMALTNPTVRKKLLYQFADNTDSASVHLKAAALPHQASHVILPLANIKPNEVFAPRYNNGEPVVLVRYPHGGTFEIPELVVNNRNAEGRKLIGTNSPDAIGIHHSVAKRLSGADFDGDTVLVIPNSRRQVQHTHALDDLKDFDPIRAYPGYPGMKVLKNTQGEMGIISNLITDMTIKQAPESEIARAVKHSMVVIDAEKKELNYRQSYIDNNIGQLKKKYQEQPSGKGGAATLLSRRKSFEMRPERKERLQTQGGPINKETGRREYVPTGRKKKDGSLREQRINLLSDTTDAHTLSSGTPMEALYATHSNKLKAMANRARLDYLNTPSSKYSSTAAKVYKKEADALSASLDLAIKNKPLERQAQMIANANIRLIRDANPTMDKETRKKKEYQALQVARRRTGADKYEIKITPAQWDAIQAGAISNYKLTQILDHADMDQVRKLATPRDRPLMTTAKKQRAHDMLELGYTRSEVAGYLGVSVSTLDKGLSEEGG